MFKMWLRPRRSVTNTECVSERGARWWYRDDAGCWIILDRKRQISTGCSRGDTDGAAKALEAYLAERHVPTTGATDPRVIPIADVLAAYGLSKKPKGDADKLKANVVSQQPLLAPIAKGQQIGTLQLSLGDKPIGEYPLVAIDEVPQAGWFGRLWDALRLWIKNL